MAETDNKSTVLNWSEPPDGWIWDGDKWVDPGDDGSDDGGGGNYSDGNGVLLEQKAQSGDPCAAFFAGGAGPGIEVEIMAFVAPASLNYNMGTTRGVLTEGPKTTEEDFDTLSFRNSNSASSRKITNIDSGAWEGDVKNELGETIPPPSITVSGNTVTVGQNIHGSLRVTGSVTYVLWTLDLSARAEDQQGTNEDSGGYDAVVTAYWSGGFNSLNIKGPEAECREEWKIDDDDDEDDDTYIIDVTRHKCTFAVLSTSLKDPE